MVKQERITALRDGEHRTGPVVYWMSRDQRVVDNWALLHAQQEALARQSPLAVVFCLAPSFLGATLRQYAFMLTGLEEVERRLAAVHIPFFLLEGEPGEEIPRFIEQEDASLLITDFDPLRIKRTWRETVAARLSIPFHEVDAHNIVPCRHVSPKCEYSAATIRRKLARLVPTFLEEFSRLVAHPFAWPRSPQPVSWGELLCRLPVDRSVLPVPGIVPGESAAHQTLADFLDQRLEGYVTNRNDPNRNGQSGLSPYLHFGHLAAQRVALAVAAMGTAESHEAFMEELIVRRELSDNFCWYNDRYDHVEGFPDWGRKTLDRHRDDPREYRYAREILGRGETHDPLWNSAQMEMVLTGKMHGYLRMYWAKKILEWSGSPEEALATAIFLNDRYELDGRDPNGYAGIAWSIGGVHDRPWGERPLFGMVRYMNYNGCVRKFDVPACISRVANLAEGAETPE
jgi:deoxyribodipyrimidine photo-lyase